MINIFRKNRRKTATENRPIKPAFAAGRYMRYAIGEIVLVVVGILIALQINNWNEDKKNERELVQVLTTIKSNLYSDIENINLEINNGIERVAYWDALLKNSDNDSLAGLYIKNITLQFIPLDNAGFKTMLSSNNLKLISSKSLQSELTSYYGASFIDKERFSNYLSGLSETITTLAIQESMKLKKQLPFGKRISNILKNEAFAELTSSFMRLYKIILRKLGERKTEATLLITAIEAELK